MDENKTPLLHVSGTLTFADYKAAARISGFRLFIKASVLFLAVCILGSIGLGVYHNFSFLRAGRLSFGELLGRLWRSFISDPALLAVVFGFLIIYFVIGCLIRPWRLEKQARELFPQGNHISYDFYEDELAVSAENTSGAEIIRFRYADMKRKRVETKAYITVSTRRKNRLGLYKAVMTPEQIENARAILNARCPK